MENIRVSLMAAVLVSLGIMFQPTPVESKSLLVANRDAHYENSIERIDSQTSVRNLEITALSLVKDGTVVLGGRVISANDGEESRSGSAVLVKIENRQQTVKRVPFLSSIDGMGFDDGFAGWVFEKGKGMFRTSDFGLQWQKVERSAEINGPLFFLDEKVGWFFGNDEYLSRFVDDRIEKLRFFERYPYVKKIQFANGKSGWLIDVVEGKPRFQRTRDGGITWEAIRIDNDLGAGDFQFLNESDGFAITFDGLYRTSDGGSSWTLLKKQPRKNGFDKVYFLDPQTGWVANGSESCFTNNGGADWKCRTRTKNSTQRQIRSLLFANLKSGWLLTDEGLYSSTDSGASWQHVPINVDSYTF